MKHLIIAALTLLPVSAHATGLYQCEDVASSDWLSEPELTDKLVGEGWQVQRMKKDGGCWEVYGNMPDGKRVEAYFHPSTGETKLINQRGTILFRADN